MSEVCSECKEKKVQKLPENECLTCSKFCVKYYCGDCQNKHQCNDGFWESKKEESTLEIIFRKFTQAVVLEMDRIIKDIVNENSTLKRENDSLQKKCKELDDSNRRNNE